ncbi:MAG: mechanosensitive ion channel family protein [Chlorobiales bacterium]|nr:mechanosensitive ion channel family protein [Chlorobiales bacterium]
MEEVLSYKLFGTPVASWLIALAVTVGISGGLFLLEKFLAWRLHEFAKKTETKIDDAISVLIKKTKWYFLFAIGIYFALVTVKDLPKIERTLIDQSIKLVILIQIAIWANTMINFWVKSYKDEKLPHDAASVTTFSALGFVAKLALYAIVLLLVLDNFGINITTLVASLGVGGIAVALAVQNILGDLFASLSISLDKPFVIGDFIAVDMHKGTVEKVGLKTTRIKSLSGEQIVFSNADLLKSRIQNFKKMEERRVIFPFGIRYETPYQKITIVPGIMREIIESIDQTRFDRAHFKAYGDFSLNFEVVYFVLSPDMVLYMDVQQKINLAMYERFMREGIEFAYPTQTVYLNQQTGHEGAGL